MESVQRRNAALREVVGPPVAAHLKDTHDKGAGEYTILKRRQAIAAAIAVPEIRATLESHPGFAGHAMPPLPTLERLLRERLGPANRENYRDHLERLAGANASYAGAAAVVDATGWEARYRTGEIREKQKQWIFLCVDVASAHIWAADLVASSESEGWRPNDQPDRQDVMVQFIRKLGWFPEWLINDKISTLTHRLSLLQPGQHPTEKLSMGALLWLCGGARPYVRMGDRPTGGAAAEVGVKCAKGALAQVSTRNAIRKETAGLGLRPLNEYESHLEFLALLNEAIALTNNSVLTRRGCPLTRAQLLALPKGATGRAGRAVAADLWENVDLARGEIRDDGDGVPKWKRLVIATRMGRVLSGRMAVQFGGKAWTAELDRPENGWEFAPEEKTVLVMPPGARQDDADPEAFRVIVVDDNRSNPRYQTATAKAIKIDEYYQDLTHPMLGAYKALPWTAADHQADRRDADAKEWRQTHAREPLKQATSDEIVR